MITTATSHVRTPFNRNGFLKAVAAGFVLIWLIAAIQPSYRFDWFLENLLVFAGVALMIATYRRFHFSDVSYLLFAAFLVLHTVGAHYTYSEVPAGYWVQHALGLSRNHYDRIVHFSFGLLMVYPVREVLIRAVKLRGRAAALLSFAVVVAMSATFEIIEWLIATVVSPTAAFAYLGTQGDEFDSEKDMALALVGAAITLTLVGISKVARRRRKTPAH